jgi:SNF2 family DNA or RNA helicase
LEAVKNQRFTKATEPILPIKATLILTTNSLLGQWEDAVDVHAPGLVVRRHHPASGHKLKFTDLCEADVVLSTATFEWASIFVQKFKFRRVVLDEAHLLGTTTVRLPYAERFVSDHHWCVTATPFTSSITELDKQCQFLSLHSRACYHPEELKRRMIRHTKTQQINGAAALSLPAATTTVRRLTLSDTEKVTYLQCQDYRLNRRWESRIDYAFTCWYSPYMGPLIDEQSTKLKALYEDVSNLLKAEPNMRAVIFTQFREQQKCLQVVLQALKLKVYLFHGGTPVAKREKNIREFQSQQHEGPAVFLITFRAGSVGITLTAASHVFLMEPCIDPATEVQAAGRIHRLGQKKAVGVTKYVYDGTVESHIVKLHDEIEQKGNDDLIDGNKLGHRAIKILTRD